MDIPYEQIKYITSVILITIIIILILLLGYKCLIKKEFLIMMSPNKQAIDDFLGVSFIIFTNTLPTGYSNTNYAKNSDNNRDLAFTVFNKYNYKTLFDNFRKNIEFLMQKYNYDKTFSTFHSDYTLINPTNKDLLKNYYHGISEYLYFIVYFINDVLYDSDDYLPLQPLLTIDNLLTLETSIAEYAQLL